MNKDNATIETPHLVLKKFIKDDYKAMYENWASDNEATRYMSWDSHKSIEESKEKVEKILQKYENELVCIDWTINPKETGKTIGSIGLLKDYTSEHNRYIVGYIIGKRWWGNGFTTEALKAVIDYAFESLKCDEIWSCHRIENIASERVMQKAGMMYMRTCEDTYNGVTAMKRWYGINKRQYKEKLL